jgi:hypothetical protein
MTLADHLPTARDADQIIDAIDAHREAAAALEDVFADLPTVVDHERAMAGQEKLNRAVPAERQALQALTGLTPTSGGLSALSGYVDALQARTLWGSFDHGSDLITTLGANVLRSIAA